MILLIALPIFTQHLDAIQTQNEPKAQSENFWKKNKTKILIASALVAIAAGGGAFYYLKNKKATKPLLSGTGSGITQPNPTEPTPSGSTTDQPSQTQPVQRDTNKEAKDMAEVFIDQYNILNPNEKISGNIAKTNLTDIIDKQISMQDEKAVDQIDYLKEIKSKIQQSSLSEFEVALE